MSLCPKGYRKQAGDNTYVQTCIDCGVDFHFRLAENGSRPAVIRCEECWHVHENFRRDRELALRTQRRAEARALRDAEKLARGERLRKAHPPRQPSNQPFDHLEQLRRYKETPKPPCIPTGLHTIASWQREG